MSCFSASPTVAAFARASNIGPAALEDDDDDEGIIGMVAQEMADEIRRAREEDSDTQQDIEQQGENTGEEQGGIVPNQKRRASSRWFPSEVSALRKHGLPMHLLCGLDLLTPSSSPG